MERSSDLLVSILHHCVKGTSAWQLNITVEELYGNLSKEKQEEWPPHLIQGHIYLLADAGYIEMKGHGTYIVRVTWAGYEFLEGALKERAIRDNPFLAQG